MNVSLLEYRRAENEKVKLEKRIKEVNEALKAAISHGDLSENSEYDECKRTMESLKKEYNKVLNIIDSYSSDKEYDENRITLGSLVEIRYDDEVLRLVIANEGTPLIEHVLSSSSPLGKAVLESGESGQYKLDNGKEFDVKLLPKKEFENFLEEFLDVEATMRNIIYGGGASCE